MKAVIIGPGKIGCGFAGQLLSESGFEVVFLARNPRLVDHLNRVRRYGLLLSDGHGSIETFVEGVRAVDLSARETSLREIADADVIVTAVGANNLPRVTPLIAAGLARRARGVNVLAFENLRHASRKLRQLLALELPEARGEPRFGASGALIERVVARRLGDPESDEPLVFVGDTCSSFRVDGPQLREPLPAIRGMIVTDRYEAWVQRKLYTYSAGHATAAYLGYLKGYRYIHTAVRDREIRAEVLAAMTEGQRGLAARFGTEIAGEFSDLLTILARFENATIGDRIERVGRDPRRKLTTDERIVGAARLAEKAGIRPLRLARAAAAALYFFNPMDPSTSRLRSEIETNGIERTIHLVCSLDHHRDLGRLVRDDWELLANGWDRQNLLLSLRSRLWSGNGGVSCERGSPAPGSAPGENEQVSTDGPRPLPHASGGRGGGK